MRRWIAEALGELNGIDNSWEFVDVKELNAGVGMLSSASETRIYQER